MGGKKDRRNELRREWEAGREEESYAKPSGSNSTSNGVGTEREVDEGEDDRGNGQTNNHTSGKASRKNGGGRPSQKGHQLQLGQWTEAVDTVVDTMSDAQKAIKHLEEVFILHKDSLQKIDETTSELTELRQSCSEKDDEIRRRGETITTLKSMDQKIEDEINLSWVELRNQEAKLTEKKEKHENRVKIAMEEVELNSKLKAEKLETHLSQIHDERREVLEAEFAETKAEHEKIITDLKESNKGLLIKEREQKGTIKDLSDKLEKSNAQSEVFEIAKDSFKREKIDREKELNKMKREFALDSKEKDYFVQGFAKIYDQISEISQQYFHDIYEDQDAVHDVLATKDICFKSVPIDDSDESHSLRTAHAQRIISNAICEFIWRPFSSDLTLLQPKLTDLFSNISTEVAKYSPDGRAAQVYTALTIRAIQSLPVDLMRPKSPGDIKHSPTSTTRIEKTLSAICSCLSPLVNSSQNEAFEKDLSMLVTSAIDIWNDAQTGELKIIVSQVLKPVNYNEWRSEQFDSYDERTPDIVSETHPRIFTLFPRILACGVAGLANPNTGLPGGWPEPDQVPLVGETIIYPGRGLPERSSLVVRGKAAQEERNDFLKEAREDAKRRYDIKRNNSGHWRRDSKSSVKSGPPSPSQLWKAEGTMTFPEK